MRRVRRILFGSFAALSLLLCATTAVMWVRSYFTADYLRHTQPSRERGAESALGQFLVTTGKYTPAWFTRSSWEYEARKPSDLSTHIRPEYEDHWRALGVRVCSGDSAAGGVHVMGYGIIIPYWLPLVAFGALPVCWTVAYRTRLRANNL